MSIVVFAEIQEGQVKKSSLEAVSYARSLAGSLGMKVVAVALGPAADVSGLAHYGADMVWHATDASFSKFESSVYAGALAQAAQKADAKVVIFSNTYSGKSLAPRVAVRLQASLASGVVSHPDLSQGFQVKKSAYSGKGFTWVDLQGDIKVLALTPNSFSLIEQPTGAQTENISLEIPSAQTQSIQIDTVKGKIPLTEAEIVVSGGRGWKGPEHWGMVEELAQLLGGATACSKPVSDMHWRPHDEHVGQTGITIKPNLYIATGISGAIQHLAGVSSSKVIVAINKDPEAPFFKVADYGIVGDVFEVMPQIIEAAKKFKAQQN